MEAHDTILAVALNTPKGDWFAFILHTKFLLVYIRQIMLICSSLQVNSLEEAQKERAAKINSRWRFLSSLYPSFTLNSTILWPKWTSLIPYFSMSVLISLCALSIFEIFLTFQANYIYFCAYMWLKCVWHRWYILWTSLDCGIGCRCCWGCRTWGWGGTCTSVIISCMLEDSLATSMIRKIMRIGRQTAHATTLMMISSVAKGPS